jgi:hypothetical protein
LALRPDDKTSLPADKKALASQDVFMREVDEALREDQLKTAMTRYGVLAAIGVVALLLALGGWLWWREHQQTVAGQRGEKYTVALDQVEAGQLGPAEAALKPLASDGPAGVRAAALLMQAGIAADQGRKAEAATLYAQVASDAAMPQPYRDLATIRDVAINFDTLAPDVVIARLKPLAVPGNAWFGSAGELVGAAYLKQGKNDLAGPLFAQIAKDPSVPETLRSRTRQMSGLLGVDAVVDVDSASNSSPVAGAAPAAPAPAPAR